LLPPILTTMKRYGNNKTTITFLQNPYKSPCVFSPYVKLTSGTMREWFTKDGMLKENYIQVMECETTKKDPKQNVIEFE